MEGFKNDKILCRALQTLAGEVLRVGVHEALSSPLASFMWDAVTDKTSPDKTSRREKGMLWLRHLDSSLTWPQNSFIANVHLPRTDSTTEAGIIKDLLAAWEVEGDHLEGHIISSTLDGASVNLGVKPSRLCM